MSDEKKPREFWIKGSIAHEFEVVNSIHVIEKSAYDALQAKADKLAEALEKYYGQTAVQWSEVDSPTSKIKEMIDLGYVAKQALKEYRGEK